ncbi:MAG: hypothetical protein ABW221_10985, partial [Vicinamibacteria bacterium]
MSTARFLAMLPADPAVSEPESLQSPLAVARFGRFEADLERGTLSREGALVKLQPQPFKVLAL